MGIMALTAKFERDGVMYVVLSGYADNREIFEFVDGVGRYGSGWWLDD